MPRMSEPALSIHLQAAQGYLELGMLEEALGELSFIDHTVLDDPDILELRLHILMQGERWEEALAVSQQILLTHQEMLPAYIQGAFALHELGRTAEARDLLLKGPSLLHQDPTFHYNIGCYQAVLGNREEAIESLFKSFELDASFREFAKRDPDLVQILPSL